MEDFKAELAVLLRKHDVYIVAKSNANESDFSIEIGFQTLGGKSDWTNRHHLGAYDLDGGVKK